MTLMAAGLSRLEQEHSMHSIDPVRQARRRVLRCITSIGHKMELSAQQVAMYLLNLPDHYTSHQFVDLSWQDINYFVRAYWEHTITRGIKSATTDPEPESDKDGPSDDDDDDTLELDENGNLLRTEHTIVTQQPDGHIVQTNQRLDYILRGDKYDQCCLYDFIAGFWKRKTNDCEDANSVTGLQHDHPQWTTHTFRERLPGRWLIPVLQGPMVPVRAQHPDIFYCMALTLFKPWRHPRDLKEEGATWSDAFEQWVQHASERHVSLINNLDLLHHCRQESDKTRRQMRRNKKQRLPPNERMQFAQEK